MGKRWGVIGCGWLGLPFAKQAVEQGEEVIGSTTSLEKLETLRKIGMSPVLLSLKKDNNSKNEFKTCDFVLLNIPPSSLKESYADKLHDLVVQFNPNSRVVFISSTSVYADKNQIAEEDDELDGEGRNASYIIDAEERLQQVLKERLTIIRMAGLVGGERHPAKFMSGKDYTGGLNKINLIHLDDCIGIINKVVEQNYFGKILNGCTTEHPTKWDYYTYAAKQMNIAPPSFQKNEGKWKEVSNKKSKTSLNFNYKYSSPFDFPL